MSETVSQVCPLCDTQPDSHGHLFFTYSFSTEVWKGVFQFAIMACPSNNGEDVIHKFRSFAKRKSARSVIAKLILAVVSYFIWQERNARLFSKGKRSTQQLVQEIMGTIRLKLFTIRFKQNTRSAKIMDTWQLSASGMRDT